MYAHCVLNVGIPDLNDIWSKASGLSGRWDSVGLMLGLSVRVIEEIDKDNPNDSRKCLRKVYTRWLEKGYDYERHGHPCWRMLCVCIKSPSGGNDAALAEEIAKEHPASPDSAGEPKSLLPTSSKGM